MLCCIFTLPAPQLSFIDLSFNDFTNASASLLWLTFGSIDVSNCALSGTLPVDVDHAGISSLNVSHNYFVGPLPQGLIQVTARDVVLDLSDNCMDTDDEASIQSFCHGQGDYCVLDQLPPSNCANSGPRPLPPDSVAAVAGVLSAVVSWQRSPLSNPPVMQVAEARIRGRSNTPTHS